MEEEIYEILKSIRPEFNFKSSDNFITDGMLDSFDVISLVDMIEEKYNISIDALDIVPENFSTVEEIAKLINKSGGKK